MGHAKSGTDCQQGLIQCHGPKLTQVRVLRRGDIEIQSAGNWSRGARVFGATERASSASGQSVRVCVCVCIYVYIKDMPSSVCFHGNGFHCCKAVVIGSQHPYMTVQLTLKEVTE
jgi:hypothetical protein